MRFRFATRRSFLRLGVLFLLLAVLAIAAYFYMIRMPGESYAGPLPALTDEQRELADDLSQYVHHLAGDAIGERYNSRQIAVTVDWLMQSVEAMGYGTIRQHYRQSCGTCINVIVERKGTSRADEIIVVGAHFDTVERCPGANDNGSGVAATLALARRFAEATPQRTIRFAFFAHEEPPTFQTDEMGSLEYAKSCKHLGDNVVAMFSMETIGYYSDAPDSQKYPPGFNLLYPSTGNFIAFVGNLGSRSLVRDSIRIFRERAQFPSEGAAAPGWITGIGWSDHWSFWQMGYEAVMVTDTAPFRYPHYHRASDTPDKLDYERMARVVDGMAMVIEELANPAD